MKQTEVKTDLDLDRMPLAALHKVPKDERELKTDLNVLCPALCPRGHNG